MIQEGLGGNEEARAAEAALCSTVNHPGDLDRMQVFRRADAFDRGNAGPVFNLIHLGDAGSDDLAVHDHRADAALGHATSDLGARQAELPAKHVRQRSFGACDNRPEYPVDIKGLFLHTFLLI